MQFLVADPLTLPKILFIDILMFCLPVWAASSKLTFPLPLCVSCFALFHVKGYFQLSGDHI